MGKKLKLVKVVNRGGKRYIYARDYHGRIVDIRKYSRNNKNDGINLTTAIGIFKETGKNGASGTLHKGYTRTKLINKIEVTDSRKNYKKPKGLFGFFATITTDSVKWSARSDAMTNEDVAKRQAIYNVSQRAADYDNDAADRIEKGVYEGDIPSETGIIYYRPA